MQDHMWVLILRRRRKGRKLVRAVIIKRAKLLPSHEVILGGPTREAVEEDFKKLRAELAPKEDHLNPRYLTLLE